MIRLLFSLPFMYSFQVWNKKPDLSRVTVVVVRKPSLHSFKTIILAMSLKDPSHTCWASVSEKAAFDMVALLSVVDLSTD